MVFRYEEKMKPNEHEQESLEVQLRGFIWHSFVVCVMCKHGLGGVM